MSPKMRKILTLFLVAVSLLSVFGLISTPSVVAAPTISLDPATGYVGDLVSVTGTVDTVNGTFKIRWDLRENLTTGKAVGNQVTASFIVPAVNASISGRVVPVELIDVNASTISLPVDFTLFTKFSLHIDVPASPRQLQEGAATSIKVNVTGGAPNTVYVANVTVEDPTNQTHSAIVQLSNTTTTGSGGVAKVYPSDFGASTNRTGVYHVAFNDTLATADFSIGLTDKTEYKRIENVQVQAAGYKHSETVRVDIETKDVSVSGFPKNVTASSGGVVTFSWTVPVNASSGVYTVSLANTTVSGTAKLPSDTQEFNVTGFACLVQARNLANAPVEGVLIEVHNQSAPNVVVTKGNTSSMGSIGFNLDSGSYTFRAFFKDVEVSEPLNQTVNLDTEILLEVRLVDFLATVETEGHERVPLIDIALTYNYTTRDNKTVTETLAGGTNLTGRATIKNLFVNTTYRAEARRYGMLFSNTTISVPPLPSPPLVALNLTLPTYTLNVHVLDAKGNDASDVDVDVYEWASGVSTPVDSMPTNVTGDAFFSLPFGKYILRAFKGSDFLSELVVDLDEASALTFNVVTLNVQVTVRVLGYLSQPLAGAEVRIERQVGENFVLVPPETTDSGGSAQFDLAVGGDCRVSVYLAGQLVAVKTQFLGAGSSEVVMNVGEYIGVLGYPIATGAFALIVFVLILIVIGLVVVRKRVVRVFRKRVKK